MKKKEIGNIKIGPEIRYELNFGKLKTVKDIATALTYVLKVRFNEENYKKMPASIRKACSKIKLNAQGEVIK
jgi:hypothetical protein